MHARDHLGPPAAGFLVFLLLPGILLLPSAAAHAGLTGGEVTEFAMPAWVVYFAGALVVALSFALVGAFLSREEEQEAVYRERTTHPVNAPGREPGPTPLRVVALIVVGLVVANALIPGASRFPAVALWLGVWVILPIVAYTLGNPWPRLSPFAALMPLARVLRGGRPPRPYPARLGLWPAVILLLVLVALEVGEFTWTQQAEPLALVTFAYLLLTFLGMGLYGRAWLDNGEVIGRMLAWWAAVSPLRWEGRTPRWRGTAALQSLSIVRLDGVAFTIAVLYGVNHDVFLHTPVGQAALTRLASWGVPLASIVLLGAGYLLFLSAWMTASRTMRDQGESLKGVRATAALFVASLLPIAAAYHLAHNLPYLWQNLPILVTTLFDPFGLGWNPGGFDWPARNAIPLELVGVLSGVQVVLIILGHLVAVFTAHRLAMRNHPSRVQAVRAEVPLTLAMVVYTGVGLALLGAKGGGVA